MWHLQSWFRSHGQDVVDYLVLLPARLWSRPRAQQPSLDSQVYKSAQEPLKPDMGASSWD